MPWFGGSVDTLIRNIMIFSKDIIIDSVPRLAVQCTSTSLTVLSMIAYLRLVDPTHLYDVAGGTF
jgi:hypothetical protein